MSKPHIASHLERFVFDLLVTSLVDSILFSSQFGLPLSQFGESQTTMNDLLSTYSLLAAGLRDDPLLCLAQAVSWFDPFWTGLSDDDFNADGLLAEALDITRRDFPDIYALAVDAFHHGAAYDDLDRLICAGISRLGIPLDSLEEMGYGIPMPAYGAALHDLDFYTQHPDIVPILELFGIQPDAEDYQVSERVYAAGHYLYDSLVEQPDERYRQVGYLIGWLCSCTGNSSSDLPFEELAELQPLSWETDDFAFAVEIIREADEIMASAQVGLKLIQSHPLIQQALQDNIQRLYRLFARQSKKERKNHDRPRLQLHWPALDSGLTGTAAPDA
jgi:hypothetical protein